jgi:CheY-like chemotaxis protein
MCRVLIIEDEPLIAMDLQAMLEAEGATSFDIAMTEAEAVDAARAHPPCVITSDVRLLEGTGPGAVRTIMAEQADVQVIFITATPEACDECDPPMVVLCKPVRRVSVVESFKLLARL